MSVKNIKWRESIRIIWAITAKDLLEAVKNKNTVTILASALFIVVFYRMLPVWTIGQEPTNVLIYDAGHSTLGAYLENSQVVEAWTGYESEAQMKRKLANGDVPELGLVIPVDFDLVLEAGGEPMLQGYVMYWVNDQDATKLKHELEEEIAFLLGRPVAINLEGNVVYQGPDSGGLGVQAAIAMMFAVLMIGLTMVPHLMLAEKQSHTLEALLVSPASEAHVVIAKALTGLFYCLLGTAVALAINHSLVVHWWLAIFTMLCFSLFAISLGLLLGTKIESRAQLSLWVWVLILPLMIPMFFSLLEELFPAMLIQVIQWIPTVVLFKVLRYAFADPISLGFPLLGLIWILAWFTAMMLLVVWLVRRRDRQAAAGLGISASLSSSAVQDQLDGLKSLLTGIMPEASTHDQRAAAPPYEPTKTLDVGLNQSDSGSGLRILGAIFSKDMWEALHNKLILSILLGTTLVIINGAALPLLLELREKPALMVYDEGRSTIIRGLAGRDDFRIALADSHQELQEAISQGPGTWLGLVIPENFDQRAGSDQVIELTGYTAHWAEADKIERWKTLFEEQLGLATWGMVRIAIDGNEVYPPLEAGGQIAINLLTLLIAITSIGVILVPILLVEEKESHTMEALLVSPASLAQILIGKAFVGVVFCLIAAVVAILFNRQWIVHWEIALLATLLVAALVVAIGMLVGLLSDNPTSAGFWGAPLIIFILLPAMLQLLTNMSLPPLIQFVFDWLPGTLMLNLYQLSVAGESAPSIFWSSAAALAGMAAAIYLLVGWRIQRLDR